MQLLLAQNYLLTLAKICGMMRKKSVNSVILEEDMRVPLLSKSITVAITLAALISPQVLASSSIGKVDLVVITKSESNMALLRDGKVLKQYRIAMGDLPTGHKLTEGDRSYTTGPLYSGL